MTIAVLAGLVLGITEVIKRLGVSSSYAPAVALALGIAGSFVFATSPLVGDMILNGVIAGLSASGLWDFGKKTITAIVK